MISYYFIIAIGGVHCMVQVRDEEDWTEENGRKVAKALNGEFCWLDCDVD